MSAHLKFVRLFAWFLTCLGLAGPARASALDYPSRPITVVVPYTAGGPSDTITRIVADGMRSSLGQPIVIENVGGAAGRIGTGRVARSAPDGYTFVAGNISTQVGNGGVFTLNYDVVKDFEPISLLVETPYVVGCQEELAGRHPEGVDRLAEGQSKQGIVGDHRRRRHLATRRRSLPEGNRDAV